MAPDRGSSEQLILFVVGVRLMGMKNNQSLQDELESDYRASFQQWVSAQEDLRESTNSEADRNNAEVLANTASSRYREARNRLVDRHPAQAENL